MQSQVTITEYQELFIQMFAGWRASRYARVYLDINTRPIHTTNIHYGKGARLKAFDDAKKWIDENQSMIITLRNLNRKE